MVEELDHCWEVIFIDDGVTTQEFVIDTLQRNFDKKYAEAVNLMLKVHFKGAAVIGVYDERYAKSRLEKVLEEARRLGMPLEVDTRRR